MSKWEISLYFKEERQLNEFLAITPQMNKILIDLAVFMFLRFKYIVTITCLLRSQQEQDDIYLSHRDPLIRKKYREKPWLSVHQFGRGADVRFDFPLGWLKEIIEYLNKKYPYDPNRPEKKTAMVHNSGSGEHIHIQVMGA